MTREAQDDLGLSLDMLDADRLREWARLLLIHGADIGHWGSVPFVASKLQTLATDIEKAVRDIGTLRALAAPPAGLDRVVRAYQEAHAAFVELQDRESLDIVMKAAQRVEEAANAVRTFPLATPPAGETPQGEAQDDYDWRRFCVNHKGFSGPSHKCPTCRERDQNGSEPPQTICSRCQMRLPQRLTTQALGPRGVDALCAICDPSLGPEKRSEVVAIRRLRATPDRSEG